VNDLLLDKTGNIQAVVVGGGFLGIGSKDVALTMASFDLVRGTNGQSPKLKVSMTKDELTQAAAFERQKPPSRRRHSARLRAARRPCRGHRRPRSSTSQYESEGRRLVRRPFYVRFTTLRLAHHSDCRYQPP
jgi:hypothetical protein